MDERELSEIDGKKERVEKNERGETTSLGLCSASEESEYSDVDELEGSDSELPFLVDYDTDTDISESDASESDVPGWESSQSEESEDVEVEEEDDDACFDLWAPVHTGTAVSILTTIMLHLSRALIIQYQSKDMFCYIHLCV